MKKSLILPITGKLLLALIFLLSASCSNEETIEEDVLLVGNVQSSELKDKTPKVGKSYYIKSEANNDRYLSSSFFRRSDSFWGLEQQKRETKENLIPTQKFKIVDAGDGYVYLLNRFHWEYITVADNIDKNGTLLTLHDLYNVNGQKWKIKKDGDSYIIINKQSGKLMEVGGFKSGNGAKVQQWQDKNHDYQRWRFQQ